MAWDALSLRAKYLPTRLVPGDRLFGIDGFRKRGVEEADAATKEGWRSDGCRLSTYQYEEKVLLWDLSTFSNDVTTYTNGTEDEA